ncbi:uncharacterized protein LOC127410274 [Myxocyprinus asiaticus]|uniref:uncharacterized protein LOC127410274 n=1 Tax=Myxocyprinus asiaticus TaxID=70543 RepID=UPI002223B141|nr:uncharacterized protein LOC127410274 [Myxocyprinus asiaticus]
MGCSPSKGQLFSKKALLSGLQEGNAELLSDGTELQVKTEKNTASEGLATSEIQDNTISVQGKRSSIDDDVCDATVVVKEDGSEEDAVPQRRASQDGQITEERNKQEGTEEINTKDKQGKWTKQRKQKLRKSSYVQSKAEFILKAHQATYAYLNPRISKYESLLGLLDQAAQSRLSLQTAVASVVLHYEEINQALEEMATEGEQMLREHGHHMTWPASLKDYPPTTTIPSNGLNFSELPSELLQQMLLHSTVKMISVGDSVKCLGDSSLQELADYFGSLSQLLGEKTLAKHAAEGRLKQVLAHVEAAALRKPCLEDSALHSEDSGIGADNESHNGTERLLRHRGSSGSGANAGTVSVSTTSSSPDQQLLNGSEEVTDNDDNDDDKDDDVDDAEIEDDVSAINEHRRLTDKTRGTICASFEADSSHPHVLDCLQNHDQANGNLKMKIRRPKTADNTCHVKLKHRHLRGPNRSQSTECLHTKVQESVLNEQQRSLRDNQTPSWRAKNWPGELVLGGRVCTKIRRHLSGGQSAARFYGLQYGSKGPFKALPPPSSPASFTPEPPGRNAVKRLINTFSQGAEDNSSQSYLYHRPIKLRGNKKCSLPRLLNSRGALTTSTSINPLDPRLLERPEHLDIDSLPPPPPEMLMDNSYETSVGLPGVEGDNDLQCRGQQLRNSMQRETVLPNRANMQRGSMSFSDTRYVRQDALVGACIKMDFEREVAAPLDHLRKAVHLPHSAESSAKTGVANGGTHRSSPHQGCDKHFEGEAATPHPPTTPPVSRTRLPPSCPTVYHAVPSPPSTACPPSGKQAPSTTPTTSCIQRWAMAEENIHSASSTQSFFEARAVFCQDNQSNNTWRPTCTSTLPRPWGEPARGRLPTARLKQSFVRRSPSDHRSSHSEQPQSSPNAKQQDQGSDVTALTSEGTVMASITPEDNSSDTEPYAVNLSTHSMLVGEEITD